MSSSTPEAAQAPSSPPSSTLSKDVLASLVVFLVAVPLGLGISLASGAPSVLPGLIACAIGGIVAGMFGGAPLQVSGPAAGLTVIVYSMIQQFGWQTMCAITVAAGCIQLIFGSLKISRASLAISPAVVHGMLAGIGIVITLAQLHVLLGEKPEVNAWHNLLDLPHEIITLHGHSTFIGLLTIGILLGWQYVPKKIRSIPAALIAIVTATVVANVFWLDVAKVQLPTNLFSYTLPKLPDFAGINAFLAAALTIAIVASVESLLSAVATDQMHTGERANLDKEIIGQGLTNITSGMFGGLPVTGVIVRSATNIAAGAKTRLSAILHGVWIIVFVVFFSPLITKVPLAALAGLLVHVGLRLVNVHHIRDLRTHGEVAVYYVTVIGVTFTSLLEGVVIGVALSFLMLLRRLSQSHISVKNEGTRWHVRLDGAMTFFAVPRLSQKLAEIPTGAPVDIDLMVEFMDHAAFEALHNWRTTHEKMGGSVDIDELHERWYESAAKGDPLSVKPRRSSLLSRLRPSLRKQRPDGKKMEEMVENVVAFNKTGGDEAKPLFSRLAHEGQTPNVLFIGCCDSRVDPDYYLHPGPGDLFILRNIGNLVPSFDMVTKDKGDTSVAAALDYSLGVLGVEHIVLCGHSECGAMKAIQTHQTIENSVGIADWLRAAQPSMQRWTKQNKDTSLMPHNHLAQVNVLQQLEHLRSFPEVQQREAEGRLHLWGWYFDIEAPAILVYDDELQSFTRLDEKKAAQLFQRAADNLPKLEANPL